jgi:hypothetical protein
MNVALSATVSMRVPTFGALHEPATPSSWRLFQLLGRLSLRCRFEVKARSAAISIGSRRRRRVVNIVAEFAKRTAA